MVAIRILFKLMYPRNRDRKATYLGVPNILNIDSVPDAPPAYGSKHDRLELSQDGFITKANVTGMLAWLPTRCY